MTIYGGLGGSGDVPPCSTASAKSTCNSCEAETSLTAKAGSGSWGCNTARIHDNLSLSISFVADGNNASGQAGMLISGSGTTVTPFWSGTTYTAGQVATVTVPWLSICQALDSTLTSCSRNLSAASIRVGLGDGSSTINSDAITVALFIVADPMPSATSHEADTCDNVSSSTNHGACDFEIFPGDEKAYVVEVKTPSNFPTASGSVRFTKVRYYYSESETDLVPSWTKFRDISIEGSTPGNTRAAFKDSFIDGLSNGRTYYFMAASVDQANNVGYFITYSDPNRHLVRPDKVAGVLGEDIRCFIATAAYGSPWENRVQTLREFRDRHLLKSLMGRAFVSWYYAHSPKWAAKIADSEELRAATRVALIPAWGVATLALRYDGFWATSSVLFALLLLAIVARGFWRRRA